VQGSQWNELMSDADATRLPAPAALRDHVPTPPRSLDDTAGADLAQSIDARPNTLLAYPGTGNATCGDRLCGRPAR